MFCLRDVRYALRSIRRTTPLSIAVALTLVVGVGLNSVVVSLFNGLLFRPAVTRDPSSFVQLYVQLTGPWPRELHGPRTRFAASTAGPSAPPTTPPARESSRAVPYRQDSSR